MLRPFLIQYHLGVAQSSAPTRPHCGHASQTGEGVCVNTTVSAFCSRFIGTCGTSLGWSSANACVAEVTGYIDGASGSVSGDTLGCRICKVPRQHVARAMCMVYGVEGVPRTEDWLGTNTFALSWVRFRSPGRGGRKCGPWPRSALPARLEERRRRLRFPTVAERVLRRFYSVRASTPCTHCVQKPATYWCS